MTFPAVFIAYAPSGPGLMCAMFYTVRGKDVYGWWIGSREGEFDSAFFCLAHFFSTHDTEFLATRGSDLYEGWRFDYAAKHPELLEPVPLGEELRHELGQLQSAFVAEWLSFADDAAAWEAHESYEQGELAVREVNIRPARLPRLDKTEAVWTYASHGFDRDVLDYLVDHWPLDYGTE